MKILKRILPVIMLSLPLVPLAAQQAVDTVYTFRFVPACDMFFVPWSGNDSELARLEACIATLKERIVDGEIPIGIDGYCASCATRDENLAVAKVRSNRVKSELITRQGLTEPCFVTRNHAGGGDYVTVRIAVPQAPREDATVEAERQRAEAERLAAEAERQRAEAERLAAEAERQRAEAERLAAEEAYRAQQPAVAEEPHPVGTACDYSLSLRANLLRWATLTPDLGIEWRICPAVGVLVNGSWTTWTWNGVDRRYALWEVAPEVRLYLGKAKQWYVGAMYKMGQFNYKLGAKGRQGDLMGGGLTAGYQLRLNDALSLDFGLGLGYLRADYEDYVAIDDVRVRDGKGKKDWWGPINAGVTLVWKIF